MRRRIELYINNQAVDMDEQSLILFTYTKENLDNPSLVRNSYSKQITLKGTARNNRVFEEMYRLDRTTGTGQLSVLERIPFSIIADGGVCLEKGYCKIDSIKRDGARCEYTITLYGQLGAFFYKLTTKDSGDALTLADLTYIGNVTKNTQIGLLHQALWGYWEALKSYLAGGAETIASVVNFNPCYNGKPEEFDTTKAIVHAGDYPNVPSSIDGNTPREGAQGYYVIDLGKGMDAIDAGDFRAYLMRPMLSVYQTLKAIQVYAQSQGMTLTIDNSVLNSNYAKKAWMTLTNVPVADRSQGYTLFGTLLEGTPSPASFLIGFARYFGFTFIPSVDGGVTLTTRNAFFTDANLIDLTARVNTKKGHTLAPIFADARWFDFALEGVGEVAKKHKELYNREYGSQRVDTSYQFGENTKNMLDGLPFKVTADVEQGGIEKTRAVMGINPSAPSTAVYLLPINASASDATTTPVATLYDENGEAQEVHLPSAFDLGISPVTSQSLIVEETGDIFTRPQMCEAERKAIEGVGVLMFLRDTFATTDVIEIPNPRFTPIEVPKREYMMHSYNAYAAIATEGQDCWNMSTNGATSRTDYPAWRNTLSDGGASILPIGVYAAQWQSYITDRYDKDSRVWKCSVDFSGMQVGDALLRRFYYYGGAIWVLNKINNYSLTTYDAVECEFVKVKDITDYNNGQTL